MRLPDSSSALRPGLLLYLGIDQRGVPLEVVAFEDDAGTLTVIHAMRLRTGFRGMFQQVWQWH